jgi:hypothetical protein
MKSQLRWRRHVPLLLAFALMFTTEPAFTQSAPPGTADLQARVDAAALALGSNPRFKRLSAKERQQLAEFVSGNMLFVLLHEMGHATTTQFGLPILGKKLAYPVNTHTHYMLGASSRWKPARHDSMERGGETSQIHTYMRAT